MKNSSTKKSLILSLFSMFICCVMLLGTTFAWFTDSVTSGVNKITAGNLDIDLEYSTDMANWSAVKDSESIFDANALWEPGRAEVVYLRLSNLGTLALKYQLAVTAADEKLGTNAAGEQFKLSDYIKFGQVEDVTVAYADRAAAVAAVNADADIISKGYSAAGTMEKDTASKVVALVAFMPESVGNEANYKVGTAAPSINLGINLVATQNTVENDSFGNDYDSSIKLVNDSLGFNTALAEAVAGDTVMLNSGVFSLPATVNKPVTITGGEGKAVLAVDNSDVTAAGVTLENVKIDVSNKVKSFEIKGNDAVLTGVELVGKSNASYGASADVYSDKITVTDTTVSGAFRGLQFWSADDVVLIENCTLSPKCYTLNIDAGTGKLIVNNSTLQGWTSYSKPLDSATFTKCTFTKNTAPGSYGYNVVAAYADTNFVDCTFGPDFQAYAQINGFDWTFTNCYKDGVLITADNIKTMFEDTAIWEGCNCVVNGVTVTA